ncbi:hypothetical protein RHECNPAF_4460082 [Rhizobium etli CNPAF512]|nr:hypothetical protein RHECNPAF_4460082 [Rhizobium etli CNPAF512]
MVAGSIRCSCSAASARARRPIRIHPPIPGRCLPADACRPEVSSGSGITTCRKKCRLLVDQLQGLVEYLEHLVELVSALQDHTVDVDDGIGALLGRELRVLFDSEERHFAGALEDGKHRPVFQVIDRVIAPFALADHAAVDPEDRVEFAPMESHRKRIFALLVFPEIDDD